METLKYSMVFLAIMCISPVKSENDVKQCSTLGFNKPNLACSTCEELKEFGINGEIHKNCQQCCTKSESEDNSIFKQYKKAVLEVCTCKFGLYPQIQAFCKSDRPKKYKNLQIRYVKGLDPIIKLYDAEDRLEDVLDIHKWNTDSVDEFLATHLAN